MALKKIKLFVPGGRLATDHLNNLVKLCKQTDVKHFQFGRRQDIIICLPEAGVDFFLSELQGFQCSVNEEDVYQNHNIVTSLLADGISPASFWLRGSLFLEILDTINWTPSIRVNITDLKQDFVYSFTGDVNFIPSEEVNFWHIYLRNRTGGDLFYLPSLIHSEDIHRLVATYELVHKDESVSIEEKIDLLNDKLQDRLVPSPIDPHMKVAEFYNYEGIHTYGEDKNWIGIYKRETKFELAELESIASLCRMHQIGHTYITPWKSLLIKSISDDQLTDWKLLLAESGINIGHSYAELNWQINDFDDEAHQLKAFIRKELVANDISSNGVIIGINNDKNYSFSHVIIEQNKLKKRIGNKELINYTIFVRDEFNPTHNEFEVFRRWVLKDSLVGVLQQVFKSYYEKAYREFSTFKATPLETKKKRPDQLKVYDEVLFQCAECSTVYFEEYGDQEQGIAPETSFAQLPDTYACSMCSSPKLNFKKIIKTEIDFNVV